MRPEHLKEDGYYWGQWHEMLHDALDVNWIGEDELGAYGGFWWAIFESGGLCWLVGQGFNDEGGDVIENVDTLEYLKGVIEDAVTFTSFDAAIKWVGETLDRRFVEDKEQIISKLQTAMHSHHSLS